MKLKILVRGTNDIASAAAHLLFKNGYSVVLHDQTQPTVHRRKMAFIDAVFEGQAQLEGVLACRVDDLALLPQTLLEGSFVPVLIASFDVLLKALSPQVLVDARMRKHQEPEMQKGLVPLTVGLGPNFIAGETVDLAIETGWGETLGQVITRGSTRPLKGEPKPIGGHARDRYVYAPVAGVFQTRFQPGDPVEQGQLIAEIDGHALQAPLTGVLRGITHTQVPVTIKTKLIEVDPRGAEAQIEGILERPARISQGVLQAIRDWQGSSYADRFIW